MISALAVALSVGALAQNVNRGQLCSPGREAGATHVNSVIAVQRFGQEDNRGSIAAAPCSSSRFASAYDPIAERPAAQLPRDVF